MTNNRVIRDNETGELVIAVESNLLDFHIGRNPIMNFGRYSIDVYEVDEEQNSYHYLGYCIYCHEDVSDEVGQAIISNNHLFSCPVGKNWNKD